MKKLEVIIPTRNRLERLKSMLQSIPCADFISITVVCDGDLITYQYLQKNYERKLNLISVDSHRGTIFCRNLATTHSSDGVLCAMDSVVFSQDALQKALSIFNSNFPDDDGVFGFNFDGIGSCTALPLVGQKFLQRYPSKFLYYPGYFHFGCQEISSLCVYLEKLYGKKFFVRDEEILASKLRIRDNTYNDARKFRSVDLQLKENREKKGIIWGT